MLEKQIDSETDSTVVRQESLTVGVLSVSLHFEAMRLVEVRLPERPPSGLTPEMLAALDQSLKKFPLKLPPAPDFTQRVWEALRLIPFGERATYQEVATRVGSPRAARAVGSACGANRLPLVIPCHRVVACHGLGGFALGLEWKRELLRLEAV
jgi:O-6-methylguanine DNA methyltransferase